MKSELPPLADLSPSLYDIAVVSLVTGAQQAPCVDWLLEHATTAHTWGTSRSWFDAYLSTYAAAVALRNAGMPQPADRAYAALPGMAPAGPSPTPETLTFGGLVDTLDRIGTARGWPLPDHPAPVRAIMDRERTKWERMRMWPDFYNPSLSIAGYCAERVYGDPAVDAARFLESFQAPNGSIANSPGASAVFLLECERRSGQFDAGRLDRLRQYLHSRVPENIGYLDRVPHFVTAWTVMFQRELGPAESPPCAPHALDELSRDLFHPSGLLCTVGAGATIPGDTDSTACGAIAATIAGRPAPKAAALDMMIGSGGAYRTFLFEHDPSLTTNIHMAALLDLEGDHGRLLPVLRWLHQQTTQHPALVCKWHLSPAYMLGEMARVMSRIDHPLARSLCAGASERLSRTQNSDGGWGVDGSTAEEAAYAAIGLAAAAEHGLAGGDRERTLRRAHGFLSTHEPQLTPLWLGKTLYCVQPLVHVLHTVAMRRTEAMCAQT
ncbi:hypothetical protein ACFVHW_28955 [Streptomyces sp. NPDC127110]|uniref:hypothetical protein n=1 Tax=Streptomyces sp. NPDC127110 TaxID=3345362 RepID=UPI00362838B4